MKNARTATLFAAAATMVAGLALIPHAATAVAEPERQQASGPDFGKMLMDGLKASEGCLGVENAQYGSGRLGIIAWFKDAEAAKAWYYSETHARFMNMAGADPADREPLRHVKDPETPVMVMATITMGGDGPKLGFMPISQISIEMYTPLPGGAAVNGRLAPDAFPIEHFRRLDN